MNGRRCAVFAVMTALAGCGQASTVGAPASDRALSDVRVLPNQASSKIQHVVIIFQENRTPDNLFNGLPGADTVRSGQNSHGDTVKLKPELLTAPFGVDHKHRAFKAEYANGKMNGFDRAQSICKPHATCPPKDIRAYSYVPRNEVKPYFTLAMHYTFADRMFQTNEGPSFPAHQYILSGTSTIENGSAIRASENAFSPSRKFTGGCDSPPGSHVTLIDAAGDEDQHMYPCFDRLSLIQLIDAKSLTWHYYQEHLGPGLWSGPDAISAVRNSPEFSTDVVAPPSQVLTDIAHGQLANVVWVTPTAKASDHAGNTDGSGPSWVASVVDAIGKSQYWKDTAIFVTWDDWGGWYDHVPPPQYNSYELGFRVPLIVISPYAKNGYVSHVPHEFGSILKFTEEMFGLGSLGTTDVRSDDLSDCFNFSRAPSRFVPISAPLDANYFLRQPTSTEDPDDDF
jgi:phospholipase C